jgi:hypothetical protein
MELQTTTQNQLQKLPTNSYTKPLLNAVAIGSTGEIFNQMCRFKDKGEALPIKVMELVPVSERIPALAKTYGNDKIAALLSKQITKTLNSFNLRVGMNPEQVTDLSYSLIESAEEDQLAIQDILLFLDGMVKYKYGKVYDRMDMPTFYEMLEMYREQRHLAYAGLKEETHSQNKAAGDTNRMSNEVDKDANRNAMIEYLKTK